MVTRDKAAGDSCGSGPPLQGDEEGGAALEEGRYVEGGEGRALVRNASGGCMTQGGRWYELKNDDMIFILFIR